MTYSQNIAMGNSTNYEEYSLAWGLSRRLIFAVLSVECSVSVSVSVVITFSDSSCRRRDSAADRAEDFSSDKVRVAARSCTIGTRAQVPSRAQARLGGRKGGDSRTVQ